MLNMLKKYMNLSLVRMSLLTNGNIKISLETKMKNQMNQILDRISQRACRKKTASIGT